MSEAADERFMAAACALGRRGLGRTAPNPSVAALVVADGIVVGRGVTGDGGRPHGETTALAEAGLSAQGATLYVTLEPCSHHAVTPPCCEAIVAAGIGRLVFAMEDPDPRVAGQGAAFCRAHGLTVTAGIGEALARRDHLGHIRRVTQGRPMVTLKLAETADGFAAGGPHDTRLSITGVAANGAVHVMRAMHDAIMVGVGTILADDPLMTVRLPGVDAKPIRIVLDPRARTPIRSRLLQTAAEAPVLLVIGADAAAPQVEALCRCGGVEVLRLATGADGRFDPGDVLHELGRRGVTRLFSEGGPTVAAALIAGGLADRMALFTAARPLGRDGVAALSSAARRTIENPQCYQRVETAEFGSDTMRLYESVA